MTDQELNELIVRLRDEDNCDVLDDIDDAADSLESLVDQLSAIQSENAEKERLYQIQKANAVKLCGVLSEKDRKIEQLTKKATLNAFIKYAMKRACEELVDTESALSRVEAERDAAIADIKIAASGRCCQICGQDCAGYEEISACTAFEWRGAQGEG